MLCLKCKLDKPIDAFPVERRRSIGGRRTWCKACTNEYNRINYSKRVHSGVYKVGVSSRKRLWELILDAYGRVCVCCGETCVEFLTLDHINGGGKEHLREVGNGYQVLVSVVSENFPKDKYQILCWNCNAVKRYGAVCPHTTINVLSIAEGMAC